jgi:DNA polymerase-3 subunit gamma/tau
MTLLRMLAFTGEPGAPAAAGGTGSAVRPAQPAKPAATKPAVAAPNASASAERSLPGGDWGEILAKLGVAGIARELARHCELVAIEDAAVILRLSILHKHLASKLAQDKIQAALAEYLKRPVRLTVEIGAPAGMTPAAREQSEKDARQARAVASIEQDSFVREMVETFDARINDASIKPVS